MAAVAVTSSSQLTTTIDPQNTLNVTLLKTSLGVKTTLVSWLCFYIVIGFVGNCMLVMTILQSRRLRTTPVQVVILSMAIVNLLDVVFNLAIVLGAVASEKWSYGVFICELQAGLLLLTTMASSLHISVLAVDRLLSVISSKHYLRRRTYIIMCVLVSYCWLHSTAFSLPLMSSAVPSQLNAFRYHCALPEDVSFGYVAFCLVTFIVCILFILSVGIVIFCHIVKLRLEDNQTVSYVTSQESIKPKRQFNVSLNFGVMAGLWGVFCAPYIFLTYSEQFVNMDKDWQLDVTISWMRFSYPIYLPFVTFICIKDAWLKLKSYITCKKKNHVTGATASSESTPVSTPVSTPKRMETKVPVPVLFATENGLHYQTYDHQESYAEDIFEEDLHDTQTTDFGTARKCDVYGSQDFVQMEDDTSDYSSAQDPFSTSNPISIKDQYVDVHENGQNTKDLPNGHIAHETKPADSGIDSTPGTKEKKKKKKQRNRIEQHVSEEAMDYQIDAASQQDQHHEDYVEPIVKDNALEDVVDGIPPVRLPRKKKQRNRIMDGTQDSHIKDNDNLNERPPQLQPIEPKSERIELGTMGAINIISDVVPVDEFSTQGTPERNSKDLQKKRRRHHRRQAFTAPSDSPDSEENVEKSHKDVNKKEQRDKFSEDKYGDDTEQNADVNLRREKDGAQHGSQHQQSQKNPTVQVNDENGQIYVEEQSRKRRKRPTSNASPSPAPDGRRLPRLHKADDVINDLISVESKPRERAPSPSRSKNSPYEEE